MKTKQLFLAIVLLLVGSFAGEILAQENIKAVVNKCESIDGVDMSRIRNNSGGGKSKVIVSISFKNNEKLVQEFIDACKKDEAKATQIIESKVNGKMTPTFYRFGKTSFSFTANKEGTGGSVSFIEE